MSGPDINHQPWDGGSIPPVLPPPIPSEARRRISPWVVVGICLGAVVAFLAVGALVVGLLVAGFQKQRREVRVNATPPQRAIARTAAVQARDIRTEAGVTYTNVIIDSVPWSIHVLKIDRSRPDLAFYAAHAEDQVLGVSLIADQARNVPRQIGNAIAGVNGDFYVRDDPTFAGDPRGLQIIEGELISAPDTCSVWFDAEGKPHLGEVRPDFQVVWPDGSKTRFGLNEQRRPRMAVLYTPTYGQSTRAPGGRNMILEKADDSPWLPLQPGQNLRARVRAVRSDGNTPLAANTMVLSLGPEMLGSVPKVAPGDVLQIATTTTPDLKGARTAISGGPVLISEGRAFSRMDAPPEAMHEYSQRSKYERHPRSAVGWSPTHLYLITVDGRQPGLSVGMKLAELAEFMANLGCTEAMNFDGGKSAP